MPDTETYLTASGEPFRVGDMVRASYVNAPSAEVREACGELSFVEREGDRLRLTLLCGPGGPPERTVWLEEVVAVGSDACDDED